MLVIKPERSTQQGLLQEMHTTNTPGTSLHLSKLCKTFMVSSQFIFQRRTLISLEIKPIVLHFSVSKKLVGSLKSMPLALGDVAPPHNTDIAYGLSFMICVLYSG